MVAITQDLEMKRFVNQEFLSKAINLEPKLIEKVVKPVDIVTVLEDGTVQSRLEINKMSQIPMKKADSLILDFGDHQVGHVSLTLKTVGSPQDAPVYLRLKFGEVAKELLENSADYEGWISKSWIQEEFIHLDVLPTTVYLPRRYAFRFMEIYTIDTSQKFQVVVEEVTCRAVSAVDFATVPILNREDILLQRMDEVSIRTLQNCMHHVFEDGPKRDRRLWIGDLRLQALANYETFKDMELVKRCLYLFAALTKDDGRVGACLFIEPEYLVDDTFLLDYSLFFINILWDYYKETKDIEFIEELWPTAYRQLELVREAFNEHNVIIDGGETFWCFVDWKNGLNKQASAHAIYIYALNDAIELATLLGKEKISIQLNREKNICIKAAIDHFWDSDQQLFVSGEDKQISYASQVWMVLAGVVSKEEGRKLLQKIMVLKPQMDMVTPYMNHHFVEALILCGEKEKAIEYMKYYWGGMLDQGADTFWELYNPENPKESPYGSSMVNSYCHAWSCTPTYILRKLIN